MIPSARVAVYGGDDLAASVVALGLDPGTDDAVVALIDLRDADATRRAATLPRETPRVFVAGDSERTLVAALGVDPARVATATEPAVLGPIVMAALPAPRRRATRVVLVTGLRGGVGRTLLATNVARRIAAKLAVCLVDATGTGAAAWWLGCAARSWASFEGLVDEMSPDHLAVAAEVIAPRLRHFGGSALTPSASLLDAVIRAASGLDDLVIVDAPLICDSLTRSVRPSSDRALVLAYDDPLSLSAMSDAALDEGDWVIVSQGRQPLIGEQRAFRALPRDEGAIAAAISGRGSIGGALGRAYDELAELIVIDAT